MYHDGYDKVAAVKAEIHRFKKISFAKNKMLSLKSTHYIVDCNGSIP